MMNGLNKTHYRQLLSTFLPRTIKNQAEYNEVQAEIDRLIDKDELSDEETAYLDLLGTLVWAYEAKTEDKANYTLRGVELLKGLLELHGLKQKDLLSIFKSESIVSAVLNGKRKLTVDHINLLAAFFHVPHELFFEPLPTAKLQIA
ncbi:MAG: helix-turn-helix domain-containing protein [Caldilineaceae bacterium]